MTRIQISVIENQYLNMVLNYYEIFPSMHADKTFEEWMLDTYSAIVIFVDEAWYLCFDDEADRMMCRLKYNI